MVFTYCSFCYLQSSPNISDLRIVASHGHSPGSEFQSTTILRMKEYLKVSFLEDKGMMVLVAEWRVVMDGWRSWSTCVPACQAVQPFVEQKESGGFPSIGQWLPSKLCHHLQNWCGSPVVPVYKTILHQSAPLQFSAVPCRSCKSQIQYMDPKRPKQSQCADGQANCKLGLWCQQNKSKYFCTEDSERV